MIGKTRPSLTKGTYDHLGLIVSGLVASVVIVRLLSISDWNSSTAAAILQHTGSANVILGIAVSAAPGVLSTLLSLGGCLMFYEWAHRRTWPSAWSVRVATITFLFLLLMANVAQIMLAALVWGAAALFGQLDRGVDPTDAKSQNHRAIGSLVFSSLLINVFLSTSPWLPLERVLTGKGETLTAYVLSGDDTSTWVVLVSTPRKIEFIPPDKSRDRALCSNHYWYSTRLLDVLGSGPDYLECPDVS